MKEDCQSPYREMNSSVDHPFVTLVCYTTSDVVNCKGAPLTLQQVGVFDYGTVAWATCTLMQSGDDAKEYGLTVSSPDKYDQVCEGCALGKSHRLPFPTASTTEHKKMDLIVVDLVGPMSIETWSGMQYVIVIVEVACRLAIFCDPRMRQPLC